MSGVGQGAVSRCDGQTDIGECWTTAGGGVCRGEQTSGRRLAADTSQTGDSRQAGTWSAG